MWWTELSFVIYQWPKKMGNGNEAGLGRVTPIPFPSQNIWLFPIPFQPGVGRGMHSHPRFEVIIKIPSSACLDLGMCMHFVLPKKRGKQWVTELLKWGKEISKKTTPCCHQITNLLYIWTLQIFWLSCNNNYPNKKDNPKYHQQISHLLPKN